MKTRRNTTAKGHRLQQLAKRALEAEGWLVELARPRIIWVPQDGRSPATRALPLRAAPNAAPALRSGPGAGGFRAGLRPISVGEDLFAVFDGVAVKGNMALTTRRAVAFFQVTDVANVRHRRAKMLASGFPAGWSDLLLGFVGGRGRHFRVLPGPEFSWQGERLTIPVEGRRGGAHGD